MHAMWPTLDRARRRLSGAPAPTTPAGSVDVADTQPPPPARPLEDVVIIFGTFQVDHLRAALESVLGDAIERPDTPARIELALTMLMARRGVPGKPRVLRRPAGLSTPESWEIHLDGVDRATSRAVRGAGRTGILAS
jgi:hypothetical protein